MGLTKVLDILSGKQLSQRKMKRARKKAPIGIDHRGGILFAYEGPGEGETSYRLKSLEGTSHYSSKGKLFAEM
jgi:hypothetical protein